MVDVVERVAVKPLTITDGDKSFSFVLGKSYTTVEKPMEDGQIFVMTRYWFAVPPDHFAPLDKTVKCPHCSKHHVLPATTANTDEEKQP